MNLPKVSVIVLSYNSQLHLQDCFSSLLALDYPAECCELILADNDSHDSSVEWVRAHFPSVRTVLNGANLGFAEGNNRGAAVAQGDYIAFLNPDMRVDSSWLRELVQPCLRDSQIVCVGSKILLWSGDAIDFAGAAMNFMGWGFQVGLGDAVHSHEAKESATLFVCGGAMLIRRDVFLAIGGFDPDYFAFFEDMDVGWRLWLFGHKVAFAPKSIVYHRHHGSWSKVINAQKWVLYERNTLASVIKNYEDAHLARILPAVLLLMMQRAYLDVRLDSHHLSDSASTSYDRVRQLLGERAYGRLIRGGVGQIKRKLSQQTAPTLRPDGRINLPAITISRLMASREVLRTFPALMHKRQVIQSLRRRTDAEVFPRFQNALISNFGDNGFIRGMQVAIARFGLVQVFDGGSASICPDDAVVEQSQQVCQALLQVMDRALTLSGAPEAEFRLGGPLPAALVPVPIPCVSVLDKMNELLWSLPDASLEGVLTWLAARCQQILNSNP